MSSRHERVLQIVPHLPASFDGVGDYALNLARGLSSEHGIETTFLVAGQTAVTSRESYNIISGLDEGRTAELAREHEHVILHYVNYGYQARGVPFQLSAFVKRLRPQVRGRWITTFHELYASGPPWKSAFWLRPLQVRIAHEMMDVATSCVVSNDPIERAIHQHDPRKPVYLIPVMSNFGEPELDDFETGSPKRWTICGGTALIARSLRLFEQLCAQTPPAFAPEHIDVVGGRDDPAISEILGRLKRTRPDLSFHHYSEVSVDLASEVLRQSVFGFIDYFGAGRMWPGMLLKSTAFAALCAHGVIPVLAHREPPITLAGDALPGPYYLTPAATNLPLPEQLPETRARVYRWYHAHAASHQAARVYAEALT